MTLVFPRGGREGARAKIASVHGEVQCLHRPYVYLRLPFIRVHVCCPSSLSVAGVDSACIRAPFISSFSVSPCLRPPLSPSPFSVPLFDRVCTHSCVSRPFLQLSTLRPLLFLVFCVYSDLHRYFQPGVFRNRNVFLTYNSRFEVRGLDELSTFRDSDAFEMDFRYKSPPRSISMMSPTSSSPSCEALFWAVRSPPRSMSTPATFSCPPCEAPCNGVSPSLSWTVAADCHPTSGGCFHQVTPNQRAITWRGTELRYSNF